MRSRETKYRELIPESHYISIWKLVGMAFRICSLIYSREIWMIKDSDITSLTQRRTWTNRVTLRCDRKGWYFSGSPKHTSLPFYVDMENSSLEWVCKWDNIWDMTNCKKTFALLLLHFSSIFFLHFPFYGRCHVAI